MNQQKETARNRPVKQLKPLIYRNEFGNHMSKKAIYRHKRSGDLFAIETDDSGKVIKTSGPLLTKDLKP